MPKKNPKTAIVNASKKAAAEREAKNKNKKVYVDLWTIWCVFYQ